MPGELLIEVVSTFDDARKSAAAHPDRESKTIYVVAPTFKSDLSRPALEELKALFSNGIPDLDSQRQQNTPDSPRTNPGVQMIVSFKKPGGFDLRYYDELTLLPRLDFDSVPDVSWALDAPGIFSAKGWIAIQGWVPPPKVQKAPKKKKPIEERQGRGPAEVKPS